MFVGEHCLQHSLSILAGLFRSEYELRLSNAIAGSSSSRGEEFELKLAIGRIRTSGYFVNITVVRVVDEGQASELH